MATTPAAGTELSPLKRALLALDRMQARVDALEGAMHEPIAVLGIGCRFPGGVTTPEDFWRLLVEGRDAVTEFPQARPGADAWQAGTVDDTTLRVIRQGGFLDQVEQFDPAFFGISPREAAQMDPQQRLLLMASCEALEAAGLPLERIAGKPAGVFFGIHSQSSDYYLMQAMQPAAMDTYTSTGTAHSITANRVSYALDLRGPSIAVDTACSSSLVALHLACQSLRNRECELALAGGVNLVLAPETSLAFSRLEFLSPDGRCKTFDAGANGFVRAEGCGVIVLKRLIDAERDCDPILAVIRGTAINQDGATNGLTAPNGLSQEAVIRGALANARLDAAQVSLVETHGTGTRLGDPIEVDALRNVLGAQVRCALGAVKSNIGHAEAAAGMAGLIKSILSLQHRVIPPNLHFHELNSHIRLEGTEFYIPTRPTPWDVGDGERFAGVSSFGFGGTNGHVILGEAPRREQAAADPGILPPDPSVLLPVSARSEEALDEYVLRWREFLDGVSDAALPDIIHTASVRRSHHARRLAVVAGGRRELIRSLEGLARGEIPPGVARGRAGKGPPVVAFVFSGQGTQWWGMGRELLDEEPVFAAEVERCSKAMESFVDWDLREELRRGEGESRLDQTEVAQPALFALQVALAALWRSWGIEADAVVGHSVGEVSAAYVGGLLSFEDAVRVICCRGRVMQSATGLGKMAAIELPESEVLKLLAPYDGRVSVAAVNSPDSTVISGEVAGIEAVTEAAMRAGARATRLPVDYAFHSEQMEPFREAMAAAVAGITLRSATCSVYSTVTGRLAENEDFGASYWARNIREPVRFAAAIREMMAAGIDAFVELGPQPVLAGMVARCAESADASPGIACSLRRGVPERAQMLEALAALYAAGLNVNWQQVNRQDGTVVPAPSYPWQTRPYWLDAMPDRRRADAPKLQGVPDSWFYNVAWQARAALDDPGFRSSPGYLPAPDALAADLGPVLTDLFERHGLGNEGDVLLDIESLAADYVAAAFGDLGFDYRQRGVIDAESLGDKLGVTERHRKLLPRLLEILVDSGVLQECSEGFQVAQAPRHQDLAGRAAELMRRSPAHEVEVGLLRRCGQLLAPVLRGEVEPLQLLFPVDPTHSAERLYKDSSGARTYNTLLAEAIDRAVDALPAGEVLRILEVGAGTGGTTEYLLDRLPPERTDYVFTDLSRSLLQTSKDKFRSYPFVRYELLDLEADPVTQGFAERQFDIIVAANVVHATRDLGLVTGHLRQLLAPEGMLLLLETTAARRWVDLTFGLLEGWWRFDDKPLRERHPLLGRREWLKFLREGGFAAEAVTGTAPGGEAVFEQHLLLARNTAGGDADGAVGRAHDESTWWIFADRDGVGERLGRMHAARGGRVLTVCPGEEWVDDAPDKVFLRAHVPEDYKRLRSHAAKTGCDRPSAVLYLWDLDLACDEAQVFETLSRPNGPACDRLLSLAQSLCTAFPTSLPRLHVVTRGAQALPAFRESPALPQAPSWGFGRSLAAEYPDLWGGAIDLDPADDAPGAARCVLASLDADDPEREVAWRRGARFVPRLVHAAPPASADWAIDSAATYMVTGGLGGLGLIVARGLVDAGARHIVLLTRSPLPPRPQWREAPEGSDARRRVHGVMQLEALGAKVDVVAGDVADRDFVARTVDKLRAKGKSLKGVVHAAADISFRSILELDAAALRSTLRPKILGAWVLHEQLQGQDLDFFVMFSSSTALLGSHGLAHYAAGNHFMDMLAHYRQARGLPALSVNWGTWDEIRLMDDTMRERARAHGLEPMESAIALQALACLIPAAGAQRVVADINWRRLHKESGGQPRPFLDAIEWDAPSEEITQAAAVPTVGVRESLLRLAAEQRLERLGDWVEQEVRSILRIPDGERLDRTQGLFQAGLDSLMAVQLRERFQREFGRAFPATLAFNHSTIEALAGYLQDEVFGTLDANGSVGSPASDEAGDADRVAIDALSDDEARRLLSEEIGQLFVDGNQ